MTTEEKDICLNAGNSILAADLEVIAAETYADQDLKSVVVEEFNIAELLALLRRAVKQLIFELNTDAWKILPNKFSDPYTNLTGVQQGAVLLTKQISYIDDSLVSENDFKNWVPEMLLLIRYAMHYNFWDRPENDARNLEDLDIAKTQSEAKLLIQSVRKSLEEAEANYKKIDEAIEAFDEFAIQKESQFSTLERTLESASLSLSEVRSSEKDAAISNEKILGVLSQVEKDIEASQKKIKSDRKAFDALQAEITSVRQKISDDFDQLSEHRIEYDGLIVTAREAKEHILDQEERIMTLIGFAADGTLGGVFNNRKKELQWPVYLWTVLSLASVGLAVFWILYVFKQTPSQDHNGINWLILAANVVRTSPVFLLVYFCLSQYTKERNIQEEYAFKAAISMTVTAYADMIGNGEVNERVKMLMDTIQRIYVPPVLGKVVKPVSLKSKHLAQATKNMADTATTLKTAVTNTLKNIKPDKSA